MSSQWIALAGVAALVTVLAAPAVALAPTSGNVRNLKVSKVAKGCVSVKWSPPVNDNGHAFGVIVRTRRGDEMTRVETHQTHTKMCGLHSKTYKVKVKQYGGQWARAAVRLG